MFSVDIRTRDGQVFEYRLSAASQDDARQQAIRWHVGLGRPAGWVNRCSA